MTIYEFHCKECRNEFKTLRAADKVAEVRCPACGTERIARLLSVTAQPRSSSRDESCAYPMAGGCGLNACACRNN